MPPTETGYEFIAARHLSFKRLVDRGCSTSPDEQGIDANELIVAALCLGDTSDAVA